MSSYKSGSTMQLRRTPYSTATYVYAGINAAGTLHLEHHFRYPKRGIRTVTPLSVRLGTPLSFATGASGPNAEIIFAEGARGLLRLRLVNDPPLERPRNLGF